MPDLPRVSTTAFVLAGGGTKGSFEAGVLQYLVEVERIVPDVLTATSAGAIAASVLAQARTHEEFCQRVEEISHDILAMTRTEFVFGEQSWLRALQGTSLGRAIRGALTEATRPAVPSAPAGLTVTPPAAAPEGLPRRQRRQTLKLRRRRQRRMLRLVIGASLRLPKMRRKLRTSGSSVLNLDPLAHAMVHGGPSGIRPVDEELIARPGLQLRLAVIALRAGVLRYVTESGTIVEADALTPAPGEAAGPVHLVDGAIASASVPLLFPPHPMADDDYVDGGVLQIVPVRAAVQLGATRIFAIVAMPLALGREERDYATGPASEVGFRAMGMIGMADRQRENLGVPLPPGTTLTVIDPVVDVVGLFEVEPGLMEINKDYGWLRASDCLAEAEADAGMLAGVAAQTDALTEARLQAWHLEEDLWSSGSDNPEAVAGTLALLRDLKCRVCDAVAERKQLGFPVPEGCERWWSDYELHGPAQPDHLPACPAPRR